MPEKRVTVVLQTRVCVQDLAMLVEYYYQRVGQTALQRSGLPSTRCGLLTRAIEDFVGALVQNELVRRIDGVVEASELLQMYGMGESNKGERERFRGGMALNIAVEQEMPALDKSILQQATELMDGGGTPVQQVKRDATMKLLKQEITQEEYNRLVEEAEIAYAEEQREAEERTQETIRRAPTEELNEAMAKRQAKMREDMALLQNMPVVSE